MTDYTFDDDQDGEHHLTDRDGLGSLA